MRVTDEGRNITVEITKDDQNRDLSRGIVFIADKIHRGYKLASFHQDAVNEKQMIAVLDGRDKFDA